MTPQHCPAKCALRSGSMYRYSSVLQQRWNRSGFSNSKSTPVDRSQTGPVDRFFFTEGFIPEFMLCVQ